MAGAGSAAYLMIIQPSGEEGRGAAMENGYCLLKDVCHNETGIAVEYNSGVIS
jgi:hypothetical protein